MLDSRIHVKFSTFLTYVLFKTTLIYSVGTVTVFSIHTIL